MAGRVLIGFTTGIYSTLAPLFSIVKIYPVHLVREISPIEIAGKTSSSYVILFRLGFLLAYVLGAGLPSKNAKIDFSEHHYWQLMLGFPIIIAAIQTFMLVTTFTYETPKYLFQNGAEEDCLKVIEMVYAEKEQSAEVKASLGAHLQNETSNEVSWSQLCSRMYCKALFVILCMARCVHLNSASLLPADGRWKCIHDVLHHDF